MCVYHVICICFGQILARMSSGLHRRGHHGSTSHKSEMHVEVAHFDDDDAALEQPLITAASEPSSPADSSRTRSHSSAPGGSSAGSSWSLAIRGAAASVACGFMDMLPKPLQQKFLPTPPTAHLRFLDGWKTTGKLLEPYTKEHQEHVQLLRKFWSLCFTASKRLPADPPADLKSEMWKQFGFQGIDPATDFRGGGFFSLRNLVFLTETSPELFHEFVHREDYPFAVAGINMTMILITLLQLHATQTCLGTKQSSDLYSAAVARVNFSKLLCQHDPFLSLHERESQATMVFHRVYRLGCAIVHNEWLKSNRNLMAFNSILAEGTRKLINILKVCESVEELKLHNPPGLAAMML